MLAQLPIAVVMRRAAPHARWGLAPWSPVAVRAAHEADVSEDHDGIVAHGLQLELHRDENDGYFENWVAPEPRVFVLWQLCAEQALPIAASVSMAEGARMLDSGDHADGVPMPDFVHAWLGDYLRCYHRPETRREPRTSPRQRSA